MMVWPSGYPFPLFGKERENGFMDPVPIVSFLADAQYPCRNASSLGKLPSFISVKVKIGGNTGGSRVMKGGGGLFKKHERTQVLVRA